MKEKQKKTDKSKKIKIQLVKSYYGKLQDQIGTVKALGLRKINDIREHNDTDVIRGMIFKVKHLVKVL